MINELQHHFFLYWLLGNLLLLPIVYCLLWLLPGTLRQTRLLNFIFFYLLATTVFGFGVCISLALVLLLHYLKPQKHEKSYIESVLLPDYQHAPIFHIDNYGEGFGFKAVTNTHMTKTVRQQMLVAINRFSSANINKINAAVLTDDVDEMRLYAQSLIEKQEREITEKIKQFALQLVQASSEENAAFYKKQIAHILWEQVFMHLINKENLVIVLEKIELYGKEAFQILIDDIEIPILLAKVALRRQAYKEAKEWLIIAEKNNAPAYKVISYLAEVEFIEKRYANVGHILNLVNNQGVIALQPIISFWDRHV